MLEDDLFEVSKDTVTADERLHTALDKIIKDLENMSDAELNMWLENVPCSGVGYAVFGVLDNDERV
jgi:hypothetical protein